MKRLAIILVTLLGSADLSHGQRTNTFYVDQYEGHTVGEKVSKAQASCGPSSVPCVLVYDPILAIIPRGALPTKCTQCVWCDWSGITGVIGCTGTSTSGGGASGPGQGITELDPLSPFLWYDATTGTIHYTNKWQIGASKGFVMPEVAALDISTMPDNSISVFVDASTHKLRCQRKNGDYCWPALDAQPVDVGVTYNGKPAGGVALVRHPFPFAVTIPVGCTNSRLASEAAVTADATFTLYKNGVSFGTAVIAAGQTAATFTCASSTSFAAGDILKLTTPAIADATMSDLGGTIYGTR